MQEVFLSRKIEECEDIACLIKNIKLTTGTEYQSQTNFYLDDDGLLTIQIPNKIVVSNHLDLAHNVDANKHQGIKYKKGKRV